MPPLPGPRNRCSFSLASGSPAFGVLWDLCSHRAVFGQRSGRRLRTRGGQPVALAPVPSLSLPGGAPSHGVVEQSQRLWIAVGLPIRRVLGLVVPDRPMETGRQQQPSEREECRSKGMASLATTSPRRAGHAPQLQSRCVVGISSSYGVVWVGSIFSSAACPSLPCACRVDS